MDESPSNSQNPAPLFMVKNPLSIEAAVGSIREISPSWIERRSTEMDLIVGLPRLVELPWKKVFRFSQEDLAAEECFSSSCEQTGMLGISRGRWINAAFLSFATSFSEGILALTESLGWKKSDSQSLTVVPQSADHIRHRVLAAAGWLICQPEFLEERNALYQRWIQLAPEDRLPLPLWHSVDIPESLLKDKEQITEPKFVEFKTRFDEFCARWRILGMITWEHPHPDGPKWANHNPGFRDAPEGAVYRDTPFHFPLQVQDGLGKLSMEEHHRTAESRGFTDSSKWVTYAQITRLSFWEFVIDSRYLERGRARGFVTQKIELLEALLDLSAQRIEKLRRVLKQLRSGRRSDLHGWR